MDHHRKVARIAQQLKERDSAGPLSFSKKMPSHEVPKPDRCLHGLDGVDPDIFVDLVTATLTHGRPTPVVVPELGTITIRTMVI